MKPAVSVVVLAYGDEPLLPEVVASVLASEDVEVELVVVDNGYTGPSGEQLRQLPLRWLSPGTNTGYTGGCNLGAAASSSEFIAFLNSDAVIDPRALAELARVTANPEIGIATALVLLYDERDTVNSAGNPVHYSLLSWAGGWGEPASAHEVETDCTCASGCLMMMRRSVFDELGGFHEMLFAYGEDVDLSLRAWQAGYRVRFVPSARAWHNYEFSRTANKYYLLERNRWIDLVTLHEGRTLLRLGLGLAVVEAGICISAIRNGWFSKKASSMRWVFGHRREIRQRRRWVQSRRRVPDRELRHLFETRIDPSPRSGESVPGAANSIIGALGRLGGFGGARRRKASQEPMKTQRR